MIQEKDTGSFGICLYERVRYPFVSHFREDLLTFSNPIFGV